MITIDDLTKDQKKLIACIYKEYLERKDSDDNANYFCDSDYLRDLFYKDKSSEYVASLCFGLKRNDYIHCIGADDIAIEIVLLDKTFRYFQNRFKNNILAITDFIAKFL